MAAQFKKIIPHLWFDTEAKEAAEYYVSIFPDSKITNVTVIENTSSGDAMTVSFELSGNPFMAISAGPLFTFNESVSFIVQCDTQDEIDYYWSKLTKGGDPKAQQCGWLKDKYGLSWQVVPAAMNDMMQNGTKAQIANVTQAFLKMKKFDIATLQEAYEKN